MGNAVLAAGVDGCRGGWVAALAEGAVDRLSTRLRRFADLDALVTWHDEIASGPASGPAAGPAVGLDVPMGLPERAGLRACDQMARRELGPRWMTVFAPPDRELLGHDFASARAIVHGRRLADPSAAQPVMTHQSMNIAPKIAEADRVLRADPRREQWLLEIHPELCFRVMAGEPLAPKQTPAGRRRRLTLIAHHFPDAPRRLAEVTWLRREVGHDDMLDAYAALWTALRFVRDPGGCRQLGNGNRDPFGLQQRIVV